MGDQFDVNMMLRALNQHIPRKRRSLAELLSEDSPCYITRDGYEAPVSKEELTSLREYCDDLEAERLMIPIYVSTEVTGVGAWKVEGKLESAVVARILGREQRSENVLYFYHPHYQYLRRHFPSCFTILYTP